MAIAVKVIGNPDGPAVVVVHGLMGSPEDFMTLAKDIEDTFRVVLVDLNVEARTGWISDGAGSMRQLSYVNSADEISAWLNQNFPDQSVYFLGVSLGGKVVYDFAVRFPDQFRGALITDSGPGPVVGSELYKFTYETIPSINLNADWPTIKEDLKTKIFDRNLRILVQTQIHFPKKDGPAEWRQAMNGLEDFLNKQQIRNLWPEAHNIKKPIIVLQSNHLSSITAADLAEMQKQTYFRLRKLPNATHFVHISHRKDVVAGLKDLLTWET